MPIYIKINGSEILFTKERFFKMKKIFTKLIEYCDRLATQWDDLMEELFGMGSKNSK